MGLTVIGWTDYTVNFWHGCFKVSDGCKFCYMYRDKEKYGQDPMTIKKRNYDTIRKELNKAIKEGKLFDGAKIFTCSWSDFFLKEADPWRAEAWELIKEYPQFNWQILTKRVHRIRECLPKDWEHGYKNVWLGFSVENQDNFNKRWRDFEAIPAYVKFISGEPLLSSVDITPFFEPHRTLISGSTGIWQYGGQVTMDYAKFNRLWVILGGESGNENGFYKYRPCELEWIESLVKQCTDNRVPVFVKQTGTYLSKQLKLKDRHGADISEFPMSIRIQQFPNYN